MHAPGTWEQLLQSVPVHTCAVGGTGLPSSTEKMSCTLTTTDARAPAVQYGDDSKPGGAVYGPINHAYKPSRIQNRIRMNLARFSRLCSHLLGKSCVHEIFNPNDCIRTLCFVVAVQLQFVAAFLDRFAGCTAPSAQTSSFYRRDKRFLKSIVVLSSYNKAGSVIYHRCCTCPPALRRI